MHRAYRCRMVSSYCIESVEVDHMIHHGKANGEDDYKTCDVAVGRSECRMNKAHVMLCDVI